MHVLVISRKRPRELIVVDEECDKPSTTRVQNIGAKSSAEFIVIEVQVSQPDRFRTKISWNFSAELIMSQINGKQLAQSHVGWNGTRHLVAVDIKVACEMKKGNSWGKNTISVQESTCSSISQL